MLSKAHTPRIALILGSGGIKCIASIGLLKVLHREQIFPDLIVGSSGGSLFGAVFAVGEYPDKIEELVLKMWKQKEFRDFKYFDLLKMLFPRIFRFNECCGLIRGNRIERILEHYFQGARIEQAAIPLKIVTTDFFSGEEVVLERGLISEAVRASIGIPVFFEPKKIEQYLLIDGGISSPLPIDAAIRHGVDVIIAMGFESPTYDKITSPTQTLLHLTGLSINNLLVANHAIHNMAHHYEILMLYPNLPDDIHFFDIDRIPDLIKIGKQEAEQELPNIQQAIEKFQHP